MLQRFSPRRELGAEGLRVRVAAFKEKFTQGSVGGWALRTPGQAAACEDRYEVDRGGYSQQGNKCVTIKRKSKLRTGNAR